MAQQKQKSPFKVLGQLDRIQALKDGELIAPVSVEFHLTNICQHDCWFCSDAVRRDAGHGARLTWDVIEQTLRDFADMEVKSVVFEGGGEPTIHPRFDDAWDLAAELGLNCGLTTNGGLLDKKEGRLERVAANADWVRLSIDSASNETHQIMHAYRDGEFDSVLSNAKAMRQINPSLTLGWSFIASDENVDELEDAVYLASKSGFSYIDIKPLLVDNDHFYVPDGAGAKIRSAVEGHHGDDRHPQRDHPFQVYAERIIGDEPRPTPFTVCQSHHFIGNVSATGDVYICCAHAVQEGMEDRVQPRENVVLGNLNESTFEEIWHSDRRKRIIDLFMDKEVVSKCPECRFGCHNEILEAITESDFSEFL